MPPNKPHGGGRDHCAHYLHRAVVAGHWTHDDNYLVSLVFSGFCGSIRFVSVYTSFCGCAHIMKWIKGLQLFFWGKKILEPRFFICLLMISMGYSPKSSTAERRKKKYIKLKTNERPLCERLLCTRGETRIYRQTYKTHCFAAAPVSSPVIVSKTIFLYSCLLI